MDAKSKLGFAAACAAFLMGAPLAELQATTEIAMSEEQMVQAADWIASAEVKSARSEWIDRELWTRVELEVSRTLKGTANRSVTLMLLGGFDAVRGIGSVVPGSAQLPIGAGVLVIGRRSPTVAGTFEPIGLMQGIWIDPVSAAAPDASETIVPSQAALPAAGAQRDRVDAVLARIQTILAREKRAAKPGESR